MISPILILGIVIIVAMLLIYIKSKQPTSLKINPNLNPDFEYSDKVNIEVEKLNKFITEGRIKNDVAKLIVEAKISGEPTITISKSQYYEIIRSYPRGKEPIIIGLGSTRCLMCRSTNITTTENSNTTTKGIFGISLGQETSQKESPISCLDCGHKWKRRK